MGIHEYTQLLHALASCRVRDFAAIEIAIDSALNSLAIPTSKSLIENIDLLYAVSKFEVKEIEFANTVLTMANRSPYELPIKSIVRLLDSSRRMGVETESLSRLLEVALESISLISKASDLLKISHALDDLGDIDSLRIVVQRYLQLPRGMQKFNVSELLEILARNDMIESDVWVHVFQDLENSIEHFDSIDLVRSMQSVEKLPADVVQVKAPVANLIAEWSLKRWEEFSKSEWDNMRKLAPLCSEWHSKRIDNVSL